MVLSEWEAALQAAGLEPSAVALIQLPGKSPSEGQGGFFLRSGQPIWPPSNSPLLEHMDALNADVHRHRVGLWVDYPAPIVCGLLRHELQHVQQHERFGEGVFDVHELIKLGLWELTSAGINGAYVLVNASPLEMDANAAAARLARERFPQDEILSVANSAAIDHQVLFRYSGFDPAMATLTRRLVAFGSLLSDACEAVAARDGTTFGAMLESRVPGTSEWWAEATTK